MSIVELTEKVKDAAQRRSPEERMKLLQEANILTEEGTFDRRFFSEDTVKKSQADRKMRQ